MARLGALLGPKESRDKPRRTAARPRGTAGSPKRFGNWGSGPLKESSGLRAEAQRLRLRTLEHAHSVPRGTVADEHKDVKPSKKLHK